MFEISKRTKKKMKTIFKATVAYTSSLSILLSSVTHSYAQSIIVDPSAPGTNFIQSGNLTPQIDIATPQNGVSVNKYDDFNVDANGLILNNSTTAGVSIIGTNVTANPNLVSGPATTIVNEVTSAAPSSLTGATEVFGNSAAVIIANPNGISCNGCSFLNTTSTSLSTGTVSVSNTGDVNLSVDKGTITIGPSGITSENNLGLYGRTVILNGEVKTINQGAGNSAIVSGGGQSIEFSKDTPDTGIVSTRITTELSTSPFAVDASQGGKITSGNVVVQGNELGKGVNLYGDITAAHDFNANSKGDLFYRNATVGGDVTLNAASGDIRQYGDLNADGSVTIAGNSFTLYDGRVLRSAGDITLNTSEFLVVAGEVSGAYIDVSVAAGSLTNNGFILADDDLTIIASENVSQQRQIATEYDIYFDPALKQYQLAYYEQLLNGGAEADLAAEYLARANAHEIIAEYIDKGATSTGTNVDIEAVEGNITNTGGAIAATNDVALFAGNKIINEYLSLRFRLGADEGCPAQNCGHRTDFHAAEILAGRDLSLTSGTNISPIQKLFLQGVPGVDYIVDVRPNLAPPAGEEEDNAEPDLRAGNIENLASDIAAGRNLTLTSANDIVNSLASSNYITTDVTSNLTTVRLGTSGGKDSYQLGFYQNTGGKDATFQTTYTSGSVVTDHNEENVLSPGRIATLYGDVTINADRNFISVGSEVTAGNDLSVTAGGNAILTSFVDLEENFVRSTNYGIGNFCTAGKDSSCGLRPTTTTVLVDGTVLETASSNLVGRSVDIAANDNIILSGTRFLASDDLSLTAANGSVLVDSRDLPNGITFTGSSSELRLIDLDENATEQIFGVGTPTDQNIQENIAGYIAFLQDNELLTAVEALRRADSGADIKDAARSVGVQSYVSLVDSATLTALQDDTASSLQALHETIGADITAHDLSVKDYHSSFRAELQTLTDLLDADDATIAAAAKPELDAATANYNSALAHIETLYQNHLAANQAGYGPYLYTAVPSVGPYCGKGCYRPTVWTYVPNYTYIHLKNVADAQAAANRAAWINGEQTAHLLNVAAINASYSDAAISDQITELSTKYSADIEAYKTERTALLQRLSTETVEVARKAELIIKQQAIEAEISRNTVAKGSVVEGERSLASALTNKEFGELNQVQTIQTNADGIIENYRTGSIERVRLVTKTRDVGEFRAATRVESQYKYIPGSSTQVCTSGKGGSFCQTVCSGGTGKNGSCTGSYQYVNVTVPYNEWVVTGTEDYEEEETYLEGTSSTKALFSENKAEQDAFINATAWRFASSGKLGNSTTSPQNLIQSQGDLSLYSSGDVLLSDADLLAKGNAAISSFGNVGLRRTTLKGDTVGIVGGGSLTGLALTLEAEKNANIFVGGNVNIAALGTQYNITDTNTNIAGTLAHKGWGIATGQTVISQELSSIVAGKDLSIIAQNDTTLSGVNTVVGGDALITAGRDINFSAAQSVVEHHTGDAGNGTDFFSVNSHVSNFDVGGDFKALAENNATLEGTQIDAEGALELAALNDLILSAAQDIYDHEIRTYSSSLLSKKSTLNSHTRVTNKGVSLAADGNIDLVAELGDLKTAGARLDSRTGDINISAIEGNILAGTYTDINQVRAESESSSFFGLFGSTRNYSSDQRFATGTAALAALDLTLVSGADTTLVGAYLSAGHDLNINVGGDLRIKAAISSEREEFFESKLGAVTATTETETSFKETAVYTTFLSGGGIAFNVGGETQVTLYNYENEDAPSVADVYPEELLALTNLVLLNDELADEYFYDKTTTLSPAFISLLTIVVTSGIGQILQGAGISALATPAAVVGETATLTAAGHATAGFAASAIVGSANGVVSGDFDLGDILKNAAFSAATSYLASSINLKAKGDTTGALDKATEAKKLTETGSILNKKFNILGGEWGQGYNTGLFGDQLTAANVLEGAFDSTINAGLSSAVYGTDFKDGLRNSVVRNIVALGLADTQNKIGDIFNKKDADGNLVNGGEGSFGHVLLHGIAGCAAAELQGASCGAGAAGGIVQGIYAGILDNSDLTLTDQQEQVRAELLGATIGYLFSEGKAENVSTAAAIALSGIINNRQLHDFEIERLEELMEGKSEDEKKRLRAAACFLVKCADGVSSGLPGYTERKALQEEGADYTAELTLLRGQTYAVRTRGGPHAAWDDAEYSLFTYTAADDAYDALTATSILGSDARAQRRHALEQDKANLNDTNDPLIEICVGPAGCRYENQRTRIDSELAGLAVADILLPNNLGEGAIELALAAITAGYGKAAKTATKAGTKSTRFFADDDVLGLNYATNKRTWNVDPSFRSADEAAGVLVNGNYIKNPTALNLSESVTASGKVRVNGQLANGQYMYVVDTSGNIVIGTRGGQRMPHPTLIGGSNPQVQAAGIVDIRGG